MHYMVYDWCRYKYDVLQDQFTQVLLEKERLYTKTLPNAIRYDKDQVQTSVDGSMLENYVVSLEEEKIDVKLKRLRQSIEDWGILLELKEKELRKSNSIPDRIYVFRYIDDYSINKITKELNYSKSQVYRILKKIGKTCDKMRQNI